MARSIVVPVAHTNEGDRALGVAVGLARSSGLPLELIHVCVPGSDVAVAEWQLRARADRASGVQVVATMLHDDDPVESLAVAFDERPDALVVLGSAARGPLSELLLGSVSEALLARTDRSMLLVGPQVRGDAPLGTAVVGAVGDLRTGELLVDPIADWVSSFGGDAWFVQVAAPSMLAAGRSLDTAETGLVHRLAARARLDGVDAQWDVLHGRSAPGALVDFATSMGGGVLAVASERWADPTHIRWTSTARSLVHRSPFPVLVVPVHTASVPG